MAPKPLLFACLLLGVTVPAFTQTLTVSPTSLTFSNQVVGTVSSAQTVTLTNTGNTTVMITNETDCAGSAACQPTAPPTAEYTFPTDTCAPVPFNLAAGTTCSFSVEFTPTATGTQTATVTITDNAQDSPQNVSLTGTAVAPTLTFTPASLSFGNQIMGTTSTAQTVSVSTNGSVTFTSIVASGDFAQTNTCGTSLSQTFPCTISVTFTPAATGTLTGAITLTDSASGSPQTISLTGTGLAPGPRTTFSPTSLTFPGQFVGTTSAALTVMLTNSGNATLTISSITLTGADPGDFKETTTPAGNCGSSLAAGSVCMISVTFAPAATGTRTATLTVNDNAVTGSSQTVSLTGTGVGPTVTFSPASLTFASQILNTASAAQTVTLKTTGALTIASISLTGANSGDFSETNTCGSSATASCTISVTFQPTASGNRTASLSVEDNGADSPQTVALAGMGADFQLAASPASATVTAGQTATYMLTLTPLGGFSGMVALSCVNYGVPLSTCTISPTTLTATTLTATLTLTTTAPGLAPDLGRHRGPPSSLPWLWLCGLGLGAAAMLRRRRRAPVLLGLLLLSMTLWASCSGSTTVTFSPGTTAGSYAVSVSGVSSSLTHNASVTLVVQ